VTNPSETELMTGILRPLEGFEHVLRYEPHTGKFFWLIDRPRKTKAGDEAKKLGTASKYKGAHWYARQKRWKSQIRVDGRNIHLGYFSTDYEAHLAYCKAAAVLHGDFANFG
jgi:hypothetical protein